MFSEAHAFGSGSKKSRDGIKWTTLSAGTVKVNMDVSLSVEKESWSVVVVARDYWGACVGFSFVRVQKVDCTCDN